MAIGALVVLLVSGGSTGRPRVAKTPVRGNTPFATATAAAARVQDQPPQPMPADARASFDRLSTELAGPVAISLVPVGSSNVLSFGPERVAHGWSTTKIPVIVALMKARAESSLSATEQTWVRRAITESDNQSILDLFGDLEQSDGGLTGASSAVEEELRQSGDQRTVVATAPPPPGAVTRFGQTDWRPSRAVLFFSALARGCLASTADTREILRLMQEIVPSESWGLGAAGFSRVAFKGGWGPEGGGYLVRQSGILYPDTPHAVAVAIVAYPPAGSGSFPVGE
ncbi:MAG: serine hydrolase, partial [Solirubrobacteraceae bacterium]